MNHHHVLRGGARALSLALAITTLAGAALAAPAPDTLELRREEVTALSARIDQEKILVGPRINEAIRYASPFMSAHRAVQGIELDAAARQALHAGGLEALPPEKAAEFTAHAETFTTMKSRLAAYFSAYDQYQGSEIHQKVLTSVLGVLEKRASLEGHLRRRARRRLDENIAKLLEAEAKYRSRYDDPASKNHHLVNSSQETVFMAMEIDQDLEKYCRKYGLSPRIPVGHRIGNFFRNAKRFGRLAKLKLASLPAMARGLAYLFNPFRKEPSPAKVSDLLRFWSKSYRWAAGMELEVRGKERIPTDIPVVFAFSHRSTMDDAMTMMAVVPGEYSFMVAQWALPTFLNDELVKEPSVINVEGKRPDGTKVDAIEEGIRSIEDGRNLVIFPEGTAPSPQGETRPLRTGIDVVVEAVADHPVVIVPVVIDDPSIDWEGSFVKSEDEKVQITVTFGEPIDPLKMKAVPGGGRDLMLDAIRAYWHRTLYRPDVDLSAAEGVEVLGVIPPNRVDAFDELHLP